MARISIQQMVDRRIDVLAGVRVQIPESTGLAERFTKEGNLDRRIFNRPQVPPRRDHPWFRAKIGRAKIENPAGFIPLS